jgi:hypothetical protein
MTTATPDDLALTGGRWVTVRGVQRWRAEPVMLLALRLVPDPDAIACRCGAKVTETCRTRNGHRTRSHDYRVIPQACQCGAELGWKRRLCDDCRAARAQQQRRDYKYGRALERAS